MNDSFYLYFRYPRFSRPPPLPPSLLPFAIAVKNSALEKTASADAPSAALMAFLLYSISSLSFSLSHSLSFSLSLSGRALPRVQQLTCELLPSTSLPLPSLPSPTYVSALLLRERKELAHHQRRVCGPEDIFACAPQSTLVVFLFC